MKLLTINQWKDCLEWLSDCDDAGQIWTGDLDPADLPSSLLRILRHMASGWQT